MAILEQQDRVDMSFVLQQANSIAVVLSQNQNCACDPLVSSDNLDKYNEVLGTLLDLYASYLVEEPEV